MTSFTINSCENIDGDVSNLNVTFGSGRTADIQVASQDPDFILQQLAMCAEADASSNGTYYGGGDELVDETYDEIPLDEPIEVSI